MSWSGATSVLHVVGARPNFMKIAPLLREMEGRGGYRNTLVHTGQHYDEVMSKAFFSELGIPTPDINLGVGSGTHATQTAGVMTALEPVLRDVRPELVVVVGDVNSTLAATVTAVKMGVPVAHVEAGLRSRDLAMPEEINRVLTDRVAEILLTPSRDADENLLAEGVPAERIHFVGNVMIDTLLSLVDRAREIEAHRRFDVKEDGYAVVTLHRPRNVDDRDQLGEIFSALEVIAAEMPVLFPMHPRTKERSEAFGLSPSGVTVTKPLGYLELLSLMESAAVVLTDSGGIQEETTVLGVPCLTLRPCTERPVTVEQGTNRLVPDRSRSAILEAFRETRDARPEARRPEGWDGAAAGRIVGVFDAWTDGRR